MPRAHHGGGEASEVLTTAPLLVLRVVAGLWIHLSLPTGVAQRAVHRRCSSVCLMALHAAHNAGESNLLFWEHVWERDGGFCHSSPPSHCIAMFCSGAFLLIGAWKIWMVGVAVGSFGGTIVAVAQSHLQ